MAPVPPFAMPTVPLTFVAFPLSVAVIVPAMKSPLASLETIEFGLFELVAVVAELLTFQGSDGCKF